MRSSCEIPTEATYECTSTRPNEQGAPWAIAHQRLLGNVPFGFSSEHIRVLFSLVIWVDRTIVSQYLLFTTCWLELPGGLSSLSAAFLGYWRVFLNLFAVFYLSYLFFVFKKGWTEAVILTTSSAFIYPLSGCSLFPLGRRLPCCRFSTSKYLMTKMVWSGRNEIVMISADFNSLLSTWYWGVPFVSSARFVLCPSNLPSASPLYPFASSCVGGPGRAIRTTQLFSCSIGVSASYSFSDANFSSQGSSFAGILHLGFHSFSQASSCAENNDYKEFFMLPGRLIPMPMVVQLTGSLSYLSRAEDPREQL